VSCQCPVCKEHRGEISEKELTEFLLCERDDLCWENGKQKAKIKKLEEQLKKAKQHIDNGERHKAIMVIIDYFKEKK